MGARVFGIDGQTNLYATAFKGVANGFGVTGQSFVLVLNQAGQVLQSNNVGILEAPNGLVSPNGLSSLPAGQGALDPASGGYYYAGLHPGSLSAGCPNGRQWVSPAFFLAKFSAAGTLVWSVNFGPTNCLTFLGINGLKVDSAGTIYASYDYNVSTNCHNPGVAAFNSFGSNLWNSALPPGAVVNRGAPVTLGPVAPSGGFALGFTPGFQLGTLSKFDSQGTASEVITFMVNSALAPAAERPIGNALGEFYEVEGTQLVKRDAPGRFTWGVPLSNPAQFTLGEDYYGGVHTATESGDLSRFDYDGNLVWTLSLPARCLSMAVGPQGDRFISLADGTMVALGTEIISGPAITNPPQPLTVHSGSNAVFSVGASGSGPLRYFWLSNGIPMPSATNIMLTLSNATSAQAALYSVIVSNFVGSITSTPVALVVSSVANFSSPPRLRLDQPGDGFSSQGFHLTLDGDPGFAWQIQTSTNLSLWKSIGTISNASGKIQFTDPSATNSSARFYRAQQLH